MDDQRFGSVLRAVRIKRRWRQRDLAARAGVSASTILRLERGHPGSVALDTIRAIGAALEVRVELVGRWRAGELDRLVNAKHSALHDEVARTFRDRLPDWVIAPEVSFSIFGERGAIDVIAWHAARRTMLVIELKTDIVDVNELVGTFDRKRRLAPAIASERGWDPETVSGWVIVASSRTNRRRIAAHDAMLRAAFPHDGRAMRGWLAAPAGSISALSMWTSSSGARLASTRRVRRARERTPPAPIAKTTRR